LWPSKMDDRTGCSTSPVSKTTVSKSNIPHHHASLGLSSGQNH
jgi:hypothetical protein